ncbi:MULTISPECIES: universal stress protein [Ureibacillus]|jgi:nucleotide-binding universal stress UspA family protein|uniref:Universal stress protein n=1 Tax=Ureibacillus thermosphaericus TaxID=51173 RepID=A0A840PWT1_URETH|nr:universal stress protein [Ureibacillus thermosphaericus]MBB5149162.1 nucleotide-binding universal stress UspA family protein [Ureibacillus thermosphaericus]NKZ31925.1 universal stress protein [Ureibacillus thermosphaericus]
MAIYQKIAVAVDFSEGSKRALKQAIEMAKNFQSTLLIINVVDTKSFGSVAAYDLKYAEELKEKAREELNKMKMNAEQDGVANVEILVEEGAAKTILTNVEVDLMVCGATGLNKIEKWLLGSVAERIVRYSKCDVLIVR